MRAAVFRGVGLPLAVEEVDLDRPGPHEVVVETRAAGLCHSDLSVISGRLEGFIKAPAVAGHEAAGVVAEVGKGVRYVGPGDHVVTCLSQFCGTCEFCLSGRPFLCLAQGITRSPQQGPRLTQRGSALNQYESIAAFAERLLVHENALVKIDDEVAFDCAALLGCGVTTGLGAVLNTAQVRPGSSCVVIGCGGVGLAAVQGCFIAGASSIIAIDLRPSNLDLARRLGATSTIEASTVDTVEAVRRLTDGGVDYALEAAGSRETAELAFRMTRPGGMTVIAGWTTDTMAVNIGELLWDRTVRGSMMGSNRFRIDIPRWVALYRQGRLRLEELITARLSLDRINEGFTAMVEGDGVRSVVMFQ